MRSYNTIRSNFRVTDDRRALWRTKKGIFDCCARKCVFVWENIFAQYYSYYSQISASATIRVRRKSSRNSKLDDISIRDDVDVNRNPPSRDVLSPDASHCCCPSRGEHFRNIHNTPMCSRRISGRAAQRQQLSRYDHEKTSPYYYCRACASSGRRVVSARELYGGEKKNSSSVKI